MRNPHSTKSSPTISKLTLEVAQRAVGPIGFTTEVDGKEHSILALNAGSSSIRYAMFAARDPPLRISSGKLDLVDMPGSCPPIEGAVNLIGYGTATGAAAAEHVAARFLDWLAAQPDFSAVLAVGHRIVHGMQHDVPELVTPDLIADLRENVAFDPQHLPLEIELMETLAKRHPALVQVACFDTAFHRSMPRVAKVVAIPRRYEADGVRRYGFHGLSYEFLMQELVRIGAPEATKGRVILAHLGNGASLAAVRDGESVDTSMGFTPASGLVMGTRSGDLDPGVISFLSRAEGMSVSQFETMTNDASGLLGISEISADMRALLALEQTDVRAAEAIAIFCYQTRKWIGSFAAALAGLDTLVFTGGIGENLPEIRQRICADLSFLGIFLSEARNAANAKCISADDARVRVYVIPTNEELVIAQAVMGTVATLRRGDDVKHTSMISTGLRAT